MFWKVSIFGNSKDLHGKLKKGKTDKNMEHPLLSEFFSHDHASDEKFFFGENTWFDLPSTLRARFFIFCLVSSIFWKKARQLDFPLLKIEENSGHFFTCRTSTSSPTPVVFFVSSYSHGYSNSEVFSLLRLKWKVK